MLVPTLRQNVSLEPRYPNNVNSLRKLSEYNSKDLWNSVGKKIIVGHASRNRKVACKTRVR